MTECVDCGYPLFGRTGHAPFCGRPWAAVPVFDDRHYHRVIVVAGESAEAERLARWREARSA